MRILGYLLKVLLATFVSAVSLGVWAVVGLFYWIPILARASGWFSLALMIAAVNNKPATHAARALDHATAFYVKGFGSIIKTLYELFRTVPDGKEGEGSTDGSGLGDFLTSENLQKFIVETAFAGVTWILAFVFLYYVFGSLDFLELIARNIPFFGG